MLSTIFDSNGYRGGLIQAQPYSILLAIILGTLAIRHWLSRLPKKAGNFPLVNPARGFELTDMARRREWQLRGPQLLRDAEAAHPDRPFNMMTGNGMLTFLPHALAEEVRNNPNLSFLQFMHDDHNGHLPGFEVFGALAEEKLVLAVVSKHLTKGLSKCTKPLSSEASHAAEVNFGSTTEWQPFGAFASMVDVVARVSSRIFLGEELCRNKDWLEVSNYYTAEVFTMAALLHDYPPWLRPLMNRVLPRCRNLRRLVSQARAILAPVIERRHALCEEAARNGRTVPRFDDAISWFDEEMGDLQVDPALMQLTLSVVALHTTSDLITGTLLNLAQRPQLIEDLRIEITNVLRMHGWQKQALTDMKLLDSVIKETQRMKPLVMSAMQRIAKADVTLSTGDVIPKGSTTVCSVSLHNDPDIYDDPLTFRGDRFLAWRGTDRDGAANLVSTNTASLGFGLGRHACAGRFFAADEIKVILCHLLVKYDWALPPGENTDHLVLGFIQSASPTARVLVKKRVKVELDIDNLS